MEGAIKCVFIIIIIIIRLFHADTLMTHDSIGHLKTLCMSVLSLFVVFESEWKCYSTSESDKKTLAFDYEFSFTQWQNNIAHKMVAARKDITFNDVDIYAYKVNRN